MLLTPNDGVAAELNADGMEDVPVDVKTGNEPPVVGNAVVGVKAEADATAVAARLELLAVLVAF